MRLLAALAAGFAVSLAPAAQAQSDYPNRPVKLVVGFGAGGSTDIVARIVARHLGDKLGQPVVVENKAGAGGNIAAQHAANATPDDWCAIARVLYERRAEHRGFEMSAWEMIEATFRASGLPDPAIVHEQGGLVGLPLQKDRRVQPRGGLLAKWSF